MHWVGWGAAYDCWISKEDVCEEASSSKKVPDTPEDTFFQDVRYAIKKKLKLGPKDGAEVKLRISVSEDAWKLLEGLPHEKEGRRLYIRKVTLTDIFGENWDSRIINEQGDACFVVGGQCLSNHLKGKEIHRICF